MLRSTLAGLRVTAGGGGMGVVEVAAVVVLMSRASLPRPQCEGGRVVPVEV